MAKQTKSKSAPQTKKRTVKKSPAKKAFEATATAAGQPLGWISEALTSPIVREAIAAALIAGAGAAAAVFAGQGGRKTAGSAKRLLSDATKDMTDAAAGALAGAATEAVKGLLPTRSAPGDGDQPSRRKRS